MVYRREVGCLDLEAESDGSMPSSSSASTWLQLSVLAELKLRPPLEVGEWTEALPPEDGPRTSIIRSEPELTVNVALLQCHNQHVSLTDRDREFGAKGGVCCSSPGAAWCKGRERY